MAGFLYAIERDDQPPCDQADPKIQQALRDAGLEHIIGMSYTLSKGICDGKSVWLYSCHGFGTGAASPSPVIAGKPEQVWQNCGKFKLGHWNQTGYAKTRPTPVDLQRASMYASAFPLLGDNQRWGIPVVPISVAGIVDTVDLPTVFRCDASGSWMELDTFFAPLAGMVEKYWNFKKVVEPLNREGMLLQAKYDECSAAFRAEAAKPDAKDAELRKAVDSMAAYSKALDDLAAKVRGLELPPCDQAIDCALVLSRNYHVSVYELGMLGVLNMKSIRLLIAISFLDKAAVDLQEAAEKKG